MSYRLKIVWHFFLAYFIRSPAVVASLVLQVSLWLNDANPNTGESGFHTRRAQRRVLMTCGDRSDRRLPPTALWIAYSHKWPKTQGHLHQHFESTALVMNALPYSRLLIFISCGSLQGIGQALSLCRVYLCVCVCACAGACTYMTWNERTWLATWNCPNHFMQIYNKAILWSCMQKVLKGPKDIFQNRCLIF